MSDERRASDACRVKLLCHMKLPDLERREDAEVEGSGKGTELLAGEPLRIAKEFCMGD